MRNSRLPIRAIILDYYHPPPGEDPPGEDPPGEDEEAGADEEDAGGAN
jgi:hypothetical protein